MDATVLIYEIIDNYSGTYDGLTYDAGDFVHVIFDTSTLGFSVDLYDSDGTTLKGSPTSGPNLAAFRSYELLTAEPFYRYCDGTTLKYVNDTPNVWPYGELLSQNNYYGCVTDAPVCDLEISSVVSITKASDTETADGAFTVTATSSGGTIKFSLDSDFDYSTEGQTSGIFSSLLPAIYIVYAKDANGCYDSFSIKVPVTNTYGAYYRVEFDDNVSNAVHIVDILKRGYSGAVTEIDGDVSPIRITYHGQGEGKYSAIVGSSATIGIVSETSQQFSELFLGDEREFQVKYYRDGSLRWMGYIVPSFYEEPYIAPPYSVFITASDGIGTLKDFDFVNEVEENYRGELSQIYVIKEILKKLDLEIDIHSGLNIYESTMDATAADDPLEQAYVDSRVYYEGETMDCDTVLQAIIKPYGARLFQAYGKWWIVRTEEMKASFDYRVFNYEGVYQSNSSLNPLADFSTATDIDRAVPRDKAGLLTIIPGYGEIIITEDRGLKNNLIKSGEFESEDLIETGIGTQTFFKDWSVELGAEGITYGFESVINGDSEGAFYIDFLYASDNTPNIFKSAIFPIQISEGDKMKLSFDYLVRPSIDAHWVRFGFMIKATGGTTYYYTTDPSYNTSITSPWRTSEQINYIYANKYGEWQKAEFSFKAPSVSTTALEFRFYLLANREVDFTNLTALAAEGSLPYGSKRTAQRTVGSDTHISYYTFTDTDEADSSPDVIVAGGGAWILEKTIRFDGTFSILTSMLLDNVRLQYLPGGTDPETETEHYYLNSEFIKSKYEEDTLHGDIDDSNNASNIYRNYLRLSDGTPTSLWSRSNRSESLSLNDILLEDYSGQLSDSLYRINAPIFYDLDLTFLVCFEDQFDSGRKYVLSALEMDVVLNTANVEMIELKDVEIGEFSTAFSSAFNYLR